VDRQTQAALEAADVVLEEVGVLVEVDGLERELAQTFAAVGVGGRLRRDAAAAEFGACAVLRHVSSWMCMSSRVVRAIPGSPWSNAVCECSMQ
jgi:hypothetical protein